jgi:hypothetical protein
MCIDRNISAIPYTDMKLCIVYRILTFAQLSFSSILESSYPQCLLLCCLTGSSAYLSLRQCIAASVPYHIVIPRIYYCRQILLINSYNINFYS